MTIRFEMTEKDYGVLKKALETYPKNKNITECLLWLMEKQYEKQLNKK